MTKREIYEQLQIIRIELHQLDWKKERWIEKGWFDRKYKRLYRKKQKELKKKLDNIEFKLIPNMKG